MKRVYVSLSILFFACTSFLFFNQVFLQGKLPIAADAIVGLYHPYRDYYVFNYPNGIPFKNFLITDPVRQQYPWRFLAIEEIKNFQLPLWNPYSGSGTPLLANFQAGALYPLNSIFLFLPFVDSWTMLVVTQVFLSGVFMNFFLRNLRLEKYSCLLGAITFSLCGFSISWLTWNTIGHVMMWLPLVLLAIDKLLIKRSAIWLIILIFAEISSFFAGHLQTLFYVVIVSSSYLFVRILQIAWRKDAFKKTANTTLKMYVPFFLVGMFVFSVTAIQWLPTLLYLPQSARSIDQVDWHAQGWFIPWQHLFQFIVPDFFGNPATLNYWGVWNYGELVGYVGIIPLLMSLFALFSRRDKKTAFFGSLFFVSLVFSLPTLFAKLPYLFSLPYISSSQPTRLLAITDFSLAILAALGFDFFLRKKRGMLYPLFFLALCFAGVWMISLVLFGVLGMTIDQAMISRNNSKLPTIIFAAALFCISLSIIFKGRRLHQVVVIVLVLVSLLDLLRFGWKFTPFTNKDYLYPRTKALLFLQRDSSLFRVMTTDSRLLPPNFSIMYHLQSVDLYDPLYLKRYGELIAAVERGEPNINPPFGFNRIITPHAISSPLLNLLNVKYVLSLTDISSSRFVKVYTEGDTMIFENKDTFPRAFFVPNVISANGTQEAITKLFEYSEELKRVAIVEGDIGGGRSFSAGSVVIESYAPNVVVIKTFNLGEGFLVLTDSFFPSWKATIISGTEESDVEIYRTDFAFRGIILPPGEHTVRFSQELL